MAGTLPSFRALRTERWARSWTRRPPGTSVVNGPSTTASSAKPGFQRGQAGLPVGSPLEAEPGLFPPGARLGRLAGGERRGEGVQEDLQQLVIRGLGGGRLEQRLPRGELLLGGRARASCQELLHE